MDFALNIHPLTIQASTIMVKKYSRGSINSFNFFPFLVVKSYDYVFAENGLVAYKNGKLVATQVN